MKRNACKDLRCGRANNIYRMQTGLWAGFSFLTLVELVELLCVMFLLGCTFTCRGSAQVVNQIEHKLTNHASKDDLDVKT